MGREYTYILCTLDRSGDLPHQEADDDDAGNLLARSNEREKVRRLDTVIASDALYLCVFEMTRVIISKRVNVS